MTTPKKTAAKKASAEKPAAKASKVPLHRQPEFTMSLDLVRATKTPYDEIYAEEGTRLEETGKSGLWTAGESQSQNLPAILWELGACDDDAPVSVLVGAYHVTVSDGPDARNYVGAIDVLHAGEPLITVGPPIFEENPDAAEDDQAPSTIVKRTVVARATGAKWQHTAEFGVHETTKFAILDHPVPPPEKLSVTRAEIAVVVLDPYESFC